MAKKVTTVTLDEELLENINKLIKATKDLNVSKVINMAIRELFSAKSEYSKIVNSLDDSTLIPISQYGLIFGLDRKTVKTKIAQGLLDTITIGEKEYIKLDKEDLKNILYQVYELRNRIEKIEKKLLNS